MMNNSICLILPYFGRLPDYFDFWLSSCAYNSTVDFLLLTDARFDKPFPKNVRVINLTFDELRKQFEQAFDFKISLQRPYKLCDFRPSYGFVLHRYLGKYDFWGHCDCDLIFGDIRRFITDDVLANYDKILSRGHLTIYRNTDEINRLFMRDVKGIVSWRQTFSENRAFCFDEWGGASRIWSQLMPTRLYDEIIYDDIAYLNNEFTSSQKVRFLPNEKDKGFCIFKFDENGLTRLFIDLTDGTIKMEPTCYVHFQKRPMRVETDNSRCFMMIPNRFIDIVEPTVDWMKDVGRHRILYGHGVKIRFNNLRRKIRGLLRMT